MADNKKFQTLLKNCKKYICVKEMNFLRPDFDITACYDMKSLSNLSNNYRHSYATPFKGRAL